MYLTYLIVFLISLSPSTSLDPIAPPDLPIGWQRFQILNVGTIDIPPTMEVQGATLAELSKQYNKEFIPQSDSSESGRITIQQKGLNALDPEATKLYVRIMVHTTIGNPGDFETLNSGYDVTQDKLREVSILIRTQLENQFKNQFIRILQWDVPSVELINRMQAIRLSYRRQMNDNPPVRVETYIFQNYDRMHELTMSYRESERNIWLSDFPSILTSFRITNVIVPVVSAPNSMQVPFGNNWVLNLIVSAILTWGIGLTPALLIRFAFLRRPISKGCAIGTVILFGFINFVIFSANAAARGGTIGGAFVLIAFASYAILRKGAKKQKVKISP